MKVGLTAVVAALLLTFIQPVHAAELEPLVITLVPSNTQNIAIAVAIRKKFFEDEGFVASTASTSGSDQSVQMIVTGASQATQLQFEALAAAFFHGLSDLAAMVSLTNERDWVLVGRPDIRDLASLEGKVVGFSSLTNGEYWTTQSALENAGVAPNSWDALNVGSSAARYSALMNGSIAAAVLYEPNASLALENGLSKLFAFSSLPDYNPVLLVVSRKWAAEKDHGKRMIRALHQTQDWLYDPKNRNEAIGLIRKLSKVSETAANDVYDRYFVTEKLLSPEGAIDLEAIKRDLAVMEKRGDLAATKAPKAESLLLPAELGGMRK